MNVMSLLKKQVKQHPYPLLFATISGAPGVVCADPPCPTPACRGLETTTVEIACLNINCS